MSKCESVWVSECKQTTKSCIAFCLLFFIATMSVSLSPCSVPGLKASFTLEEDEMELGLGEPNREAPAIFENHFLINLLLFTGIHGEAGAERIKVSKYSITICLFC